ncbi:MAG: hypothetical protein RSF83_11380 [Hungatella sp.]
MKKEYVYLIQGALAGAGAFLSNKLGILFPVFFLLVGIVVDDWLRYWWFGEDKPRYKIL